MLPALGPADWFIRSAHPRSHKACSAREDAFANLFSQIPRTVEVKPRNSIFRLQSLTVTAFVHHKMERTQSNPSIPGDLGPESRLSRLAVAHMPEAPCRPAIPDAEFIRQSYEQHCSTTLKSVAYICETNAVNESLTRWAQEELLLLTLASLQDAQDLLPGASQSQALRCPERASRPDLDALKFRLIKCCSTTTHRTSAELPSRPGVPSMNSSLIAL